ncbi:TauD/TfdA dioxygenase family protein [Actinokineospora sp. HUAS TT18]|uniref:TauD/TfdA dioxygenase family protein n=1 Tax=Actinokineospora sp. HUAS TT18 TaxID=3447451 RepID=UPI003F520D2E
METLENSPITVTRVAGHIGADIDGVDLAGPLSDETIAAIRSALLTHKVIFFRGQRLGHAEHIAFGRRFGELTRRPNPQSGDELDEYPQIFTVSPHLDMQRYGRDYEAHYRSRWGSTISGWHSDMSHAVNPPMASILRAETVPEFGGDTNWTNLVAAYNGLSESLRGYVDTLRAEHNFWAGYRMSEHDPLDRSILDMVNKNGMVAIHPVVRVHPETGERALFVSPSRTNRIIGLTPFESRSILELLFEHITRPEYTVRFRWEPGAVAFWDNRSTAHIAATDVNYLEASRVLHRVTIVGDKPVGPDGYISESVAGRPFGN